MAKQRKSGPVYKKKSRNADPIPTESTLKSATFDASDQDIKRRLGNFANTGEAHFSLKGTRGKNRKPRKFDRKSDRK
jgi:hypothetical protein